MFKIDDDRKVTISTGGVCSLKCKHCYTLTSSFKHAPKYTIESVINELISQRDKFSIICVSGDTDLFIDQVEAIELLYALYDNFDDKVLMFTTRLVPSDKYREQTEDIINRIIARHQFIIPALSIVTLNKSNGVERDDLVPSGHERIVWLNNLANACVPVILALRPTFPFTSIPQAEITKIADAASDKIAAALGEVFLIDRERQIENRLGFDLSKQVKRKSTMTFLSQSAEWSKAFLSQEVAFHKSLYRKKCIPYFMRSATAVNLIVKRWSFEKGGYQNLIEADFEEARSIYP